MSTALNILQALRSNNEIKLDEAVEKNTAPEAEMAKSVVSPKQ